MSIHVCRMQLCTKEQFPNVSGLPNIIGMDCLMWPRVRWEDTANCFNGSLSDTFNVSTHTHCNLQYVNPWKCSSFLCVPPGFTFRNSAVFPLESAFICFMLISQQTPIIFDLTYVRSSQILFKITTNKMQHFLIYLFLQTLYMFQAVPTPTISKQHYCLTIPEAVCTVRCSWWWA